MKSKTLKLTAILLIIAGIFTACNEKEPPIEPFLNIDKTTITAPAEGGVFHIVVSSSGNWTAIVQDVEDNSWLTLIKASASATEGMVSVDISKNPCFTMRSATVKIVMGNLSEVVVVEQTGGDFPAGYNCNAELFFYNIQGGKDFFYDLLLNDWLFIAFYPETQDEEIMNFVNQLGIFKNTSRIFHNEQYNNWIFAQTMTEKKCTQLQEIIRVLETHAIVAYANLTFYFQFCFGFHCSNIGSFSNFFNVQVRNHNDLSDLYAVMQRTNTWIYWQSDVMSDWIVLGTDKNSQGNALQMAQYFFETGKFLNASPDVMHFIIDR